MKKMLRSLATAITLFSLPAIVLAQAPTLGTAAGFVLFSSDGAVGNTGISQLTGNVGTDNGAVTGFGNVNGVMHNADGASALAAVSLQLAYDQLDNMTAAFSPAPLLGGGDTLVSGVYNINAVTTLDGNLYLNAQGNANAVFVFQIQAAFNINANSKIFLINGAQACNVFWKTEGAVSISTGVAMKGTIIAHNSAITMSPNDTLEGRALSIARAVTINGVTAAIPTGCGSSLLSGPAAPILGNTACYAIFSGNGGVANSGITNARGDIGTQVTSTTGYDAQYVNGTIHLIPDGSTAACASDLSIVYAFLNNPAYDIELLFPAQFGNNLVLTPHTYLLNAATAFNGTVFLNAQGNADAVFIIKINGAFTTGTYSKVVLMNGTKASNVFWKVEGAVSINDYSEFEGTLIANNDAIDLKTGVQLNGRALTTNGAFSTASVTVNIPAGSSCGTLPVSWLYFRGTPVQKNVVLEWGTTKEISNGFFTIEKSRNGNTFAKLATVNAASGLGSAERRYSFTDGQAYNLGYYRISQTDKDGRTTYYRTIQVKISSEGGMQVFHSFQENFIAIQASGAVPGVGIIDLYNVDGKKTASQKIQLTKEASTYKMAKPSTKGVYLISIAAEGKTVYAGKVIVL